METMTVEMEQMSHQNTASQKAEPVSVIYLLVIMEIAFRAFIFVVSLNFPLICTIYLLIGFSDGDNDCLDNSDEDNRHQCSKNIFNILSIQI